VEGGRFVYCSLVQYASEEDYRRHFETQYCRAPIVTCDGIAVFFRKRMFDHCFFESVSSKDDTFSRRRAERIDWIAVVLQDPSADLFVGWDKKKKRPARDRRVAVVSDDYVVVIRLVRRDRAEFMTAFVAERTTIRKIRASERWRQKNR
jgi:hypothetical protein